MVLSKTSTLTWCTPHMHVITNLWKFHSSSKLQESNERKKHLCCIELYAFRCQGKASCMKPISESIFNGENISLSLKLHNFKGCCLQQFFIKATATQVLFYFRKTVWPRYLYFWRDINQPLATSQSMGELITVPHSKEWVLSQLFPYYLWQCVWSAESSALSPPSPVENHPQAYITQVGFVLKNYANGFIFEKYFSWKKKGVFQGEKRQCCVDNSFCRKYGASSYMQATETMASIAHGLGLGAPFKSFPLTSIFF